jgi:general secretion pathway protein I
MVAIAVLAIALAAVIDKTVETGANINYLRDKTLAHWVAENKLAELQATEEWREGSQTGKITLAGREWHWQVEAQPTPARSLRRVVIRVSGQQDAASDLAVLNGFLLDPAVRQPATGPNASPPAGGEPSGPSVGGAGR